MPSYSWLLATMAVLVLLGHTQQVSAVSVDRRIEALTVVEPAHPTNVVRSTFSKLHQMFEDFKNKHSDTKLQQQLLAELKITNQAELESILTSHGEFIFDDAGKDLRSTYVNAVKKLASKFGVGFKDTLIHLMLKHLITFSSEESECVTELMTSSSPDDLLTLRDRLDGHNDLNNMQKLVFGTLPKGLSNKVLASIQAAAKTRPASPKVFSDIDDTIQLGWVDTSFPDKTIYPGVVAFLRALAAGPKGDASKLASDKDIGLLSARIEPLMSKTYELTRKLGLRSSPLFYGRLRDTVKPDGLGEEKYRNWFEAMQMYPEKTTVFVGDSGQQDTKAGELMYEGLTKKEHYHKIGAVFIHDVRLATRIPVVDPKLGIKDTPKTSEANRKKYGEKGIFYFDSYVEAAAIALSRGLISRVSAQHVMVEARQQFDAIDWNVMNKGNKKAHRKQEFDQAVAELRKLTN